VENVIKPAFGEIFRCGKTYAGFSVNIHNIHMIIVKK
jgi:hypothetical protein